jgi:hypothetical protein
MWNWFIAPLGVSTITFWMAMGIILTILFLFKLKPGEQEEKPFDDYLRLLLEEAVGCLMIWGIGAIVNLAL